MRWPVMYGTDPVELGLSRSGTRRADRLTGAGLLAFLDSLTDTAVLTGPRLAAPWGPQ